MELTVEEAVQAAENSMTSVLKSAHRSGPVLLCISEISYAFPFGVAYIAGYLRQRGEDVQILFWPQSPSEFPAFAQKITELKPLLVGFGSLFPDLYPIARIVHELDLANRDFPVIIGGQMVSPTPRMAVDVTGADIGVIGEAEIIVHELVLALREGRNPDGVRGLCIRDGQQFQLTGDGEYIRDLSDLPPLPYDLFPIHRHLQIGRFYTTTNQQPHWRHKDRIISIHGGRGCPYRCNFCYHHSKSRYRKVSEIAVEVEELTARFDANMVVFGDDLVLVSPTRARQLTEAMRSIKRPLEYRVSCRFDSLDRLDDDLLYEMKRTGCRVMALGAESGSQRILDVMNKKVTLEQIHRGLSRLKQVGILATCGLMVGQVTETVEDVEASRRLVEESVRRDRNALFNAVTIATPYPGSEMFDYCIKKGLIEDEYDFFRRAEAGSYGKLTVNASAMDDETLLRMQKVLFDANNRVRKEQTGRLVWKVETLRAVLGNKDNAYRKAQEEGEAVRPPCGLSAPVYDHLYSATQNSLDWVRLRLYGVR